MIVTTLGIVATLLASVGALGGVYAARVSRQLGSRTQTREETQQALDAQTELLDRYEARMTGLEASVESALGRHAQCEARLILLERTLIANGIELPPRLTK